MAFKKRIVLVVPVAGGDWEMEVKDDCVFVHAIHLKDGELESVADSFAEAMREVNAMRAEGEFCKRVQALYLAP